MYSIVLMAALANGSATPDFFWGHDHHGCGCGCYTYAYTGCHHNCNCWGWYGCNYCTYCSCHQCYMCYGCHCYGSYITWSCHGCYNGYSGYAAPLQGPVNVAPVGPGPVNPPLVAPPPLGTEPLPPAVEQPKKPIELPPINPKAFPKAEEKPISDNTTARVVVELPGDAKLFVDGRATKTTSETRVFRTPTLEPGQAYFYELRAEVDRGGQIISQSRRIVVRPGETVRERFTELQGQPNATAAQR